MTATTGAFERVVDKLEGVKRNGNKATAKCPAHEDRNPSLSITRIEGQVLMHCHAGCHVDDVLAALGMQKRDLYDDSNGTTYRYADGREVHRYYNNNEKRFHQDGHINGAPTTLYRLEKVIEARKNNEPILLVEGEKDVHALESLGEVATTAPMGATNWNKVDPSPLYGAQIICIPDRDEAGLKWARQVKASLDNEAALDFMLAKEGCKDVADHIAAGYSVDQLVPTLLPDDHQPEEAKEPEQPDRQRHLKVTRASDITMKATRWLWEDGTAHWLPLGALVGLGGREGVGKSTWCAYLTAMITKGQLPGDSEGTPRGVIICSTEDDWKATIKPRLAAADADMDKVYQVKAIQADGLENLVSLPDDLPGMEKIIREKGVALVILDPLLTMVGKKFNTHVDAEVRRALEPVVRLAHDTGASLMGLIHVNKTTEGDLMNRIMASRAIGAVVRGMLFCARYKPVENMAEEDDDPLFEDVAPKRSQFIFGQIKNNLQATVMHSVEYHMEGKVVGYDMDAAKDIEGSYLKIDGQIEENIEDIVLEQEKRTKNKGTKQGGSMVWLVGYMVGRGEVASDQVINAGIDAGHSRTSIQAARRNLGDRIQVRNLPVVPRKTTWELVGKG